MLPGPEGYSLSSKITRAGHHRIGIEYATAPKTSYLLAQQGTSNTGEAMDRTYHARPMRVLSPSLRRIVNQESRAASVAT